MRRSVLVAAGAALCFCSLSVSADARPHVDGGDGKVACDERYDIVCETWNSGLAARIEQREIRSNRETRRRRDRNQPRNDGGNLPPAPFDDSGRWPVTSVAEPVGAALVSAALAVDQHLRDLVSAAATAAGVPVNLAHAVVRMESNYRPRAVSSARALGMGQIKCQTARSVGFAGPCSALFDPESNLHYAMIYLRQALDRGGEGCAGLSLYERGIAARPVCTAYGRRVAALAAH
jgi:hypothetical protein